MQALQKKKTARIELGIQIMKIEPKSVRYHIVQIQRTKLVFNLMGNYLVPVQYHLIQEALERERAGVGKKERQKVSTKKKAIERKSSMQQLFDCLLYVETAFNVTEYDYAIHRYQR